MMDFVLNSLLNVLLAVWSFILDRIGIGGIVAGLAACLLLLAVAVRLLKGMASRRGMAIAAAALAVGMIFLVWSRPKSGQPDWTRRPELFYAQRGEEPAAASEMLPSLQEPVEQTAASVVEEQAATDILPMVEPTPMDGMGMMASVTPPSTPPLAFPPLPTVPSLNHAHQGSLTHSATARPHPAASNPPMVATTPAAKPAPAATRPPAASAGTEFGATPAQVASARIRQSLRGNSQAGGFTGGMGMAAPQPPFQARSGGRASFGMGGHYSAAQQAHNRRAMAEAQLDRAIGGMTAPYMGGGHPMGGMGHFPAGGGHHMGGHPVHGHR
jgi:hypothetical protein